MTAPSSLPELDVRWLEVFLTRQRWFAGKARTIQAIEIRATGSLSDHAVLTLLNVEYADSGNETYFVPLVVTANGSFAEGLVDERCCRQLLSMIEDGTTITTEKGVLQGTRATLFDTLRGPSRATEPICVASHDQSNSAITFGQKLFLKIFRKAEPGTNPDYEIAHYLTQQGLFTRLPRVAGAIEFQPSSGPAMTLATLQELVPNEGSAWNAMLAKVRTSLELGTVQAVDQVELLGQCTAELHRALASATDDPAFSPEPLTIDDCEALAARLRREATIVFESLREAKVPFPPTVVAQIAMLLERGPTLVDRFATLLAINPQCFKTRIHGDYHLGQVLCQGDDFVILDFEGEPARSLAERRAKDSPLRDVAGMLRSFGYAAHAGLFAMTEQNPSEASRWEAIASAWQQAASSAYLKGYFRTLQNTTFLPADNQQLATLLDFFVVEKALYEVQYELNNRPTWLRIPLAGILAIA